MRWLICGKKYQQPFNQLQVRNRIKDEVNKAGLTINSINKIRNSKEAYKKIKEKNRPEAH